MDNFLWMRRKARMYEWIGFSRRDAIKLAAQEVCVTLNH